MALSIGYEIEVVGLGGAHGGFEGAASGIADRARRQSCVAIGVVGRGEAHVSVVQRALISSRQQFGVDNAGVSVESNAFVQAVVVDAGNPGPLLGNRRFLLNY